MLNDLYMGSNGDIESLARMLGCTPSSIERIRNGQTQAADEFEKESRMFPSTMRRIINLIGN